MARLISTTGAPCGRCFRWTKHKTSPKYKTKHISANDCKEAGNTKAQGKASNWTGQDSLSCKKTFANPIKSHQILSNPIKFRPIPSNQTHPSSWDWRIPPIPPSVQHPLPQVQYNGAAQALQVTALQAEVGFSKQRWNSALCVSESSQSRPSWRGTRQLCVHHAPAQPCQCRLQLKDSS